MKAQGQNPMSIPSTPSQHPGKQQTFNSQKSSTQGAGSNDPNY